MKNELTGEEIPQEKLGSVAVLANKQIALESEIEIKEIELAKLKERVNLLSTKTIPDLMLELGLQEIKLSNGAKVKIEPFYSAKIPDGKKEEAYKWLETTNNNGIIKCNVVLPFPKGSRTLALKALEILQKKFPAVILDESIHHSTLKAFVREQITTNKPIPHELFGIYVGNTTKITI